MKNVAFIPVRGGSKSIPLKNIKPIAGMPLVYWTMIAACDCKYIDEVYIATDSDTIRNVVIDILAKSMNLNLQKVRIIDRSIENACDTASTESVMLEFAEKYNFDSIALVQATSPLLQAADLNRGFEKFNSDDIDTVLSVVLQKRFCWTVDKQGYAEPINYDVFHRPRRQEYEGYYVENGAFYISSKDNLIKSRNRLSGKIGIVKMSEESFFEIDEPSDWVIIEDLLNKRLQSIR